MLVIQRLKVQYVCGNFVQAQLLFEEMQNRIFVPIDVMASILPQIVNDDNALKFIETNLNEGGQLQVRNVCVQG